jgi:hypothetical protein
MAKSFDAWAADVARELAALGVDTMEARNIPYDNDEWFRREFDGGENAYMTAVEWQNQSYEKSPAPAAIARRRRQKKTMSTNPANPEAMFLHQERVDNAVRTSMPLDIDDLEFLKTHADSLAMSVELIFSNGGWWLPKTAGTVHHVEAVLANRKRG